MNPLSALAAQTSFTLEASSQTSAEGQEVSVKVIGTNLTDVYGYELQLSFDNKLLSYVKTVSAISGFSIPPKDTTDGKLMFAHTNIGTTAGLSGTVELATITFIASGKSTGDASITLDNVKLVTSDLKTETAAPKVSASIAITPIKEVKPINFSDLNGHWAKAAIERAAALGITSGYPDGTFRPSNKVTRAEFTTMITRAFTLKSATGITPEFADAAKLPQWAKTAIAEAAAAGIVTGYADGTFRPNQLITRTEMTAILVRVLDLQLNAQAKPTFADTNQIAVWAQPSIVAAVNAGIIKGTGGNNFSPKSNASRAESVTIIMAALDYQAGEKG
ncbi:S-layer homology domain-containing protein [Paenibacillus sp. PR3]|uniref:S-layer homology domain-containing protein n=2 Tax=Paenibacillus terricola TaxID=2763503 RepID=A0ABR8N305_9BACL|nr:S-layer homology domain-containing protein [Paenibacillus terricola]